MSYMQLSPQNSGARITAVIVTYQSESTAEFSMAHMRKCFDAQVMDCVVVDNASQDRTPEILHACQDWAVVVLSDQNNGFGRGCNLGLARVKTEYTMFLNPDAVIEPDEVQKLLSFMDTNPAVGVCGPSTLVGPSRATATYQIVGRRTTPVDMVRSTLSFMAPTDLVRYVEPGMQPFQTGWVCGAIMLVRTEHIRSLGGFDPRFFLYWEEVDLCKRIADSGLEVWVVPDAMSWHVGGVSSSQDSGRINGCIAEHFFQSRHYYMVKHHGWLAATLADLGEFCIVCAQTLLDVIRGRGADRLKPRLRSRLLSSPAAKAQP